MVKDSRSSCSKKKNEKNNAHNRGRAICWPSDTDSPAVDRMQIRICVVSRLPRLASTYLADLRTYPDDLPAPAVDEMQIRMCVVSYLPGLASRFLENLPSSLT